MIKTIAHLADIHIKDARFQEEYKEVFDKTILKLTKSKPDRIVVAGDIFHTKNNVRNEGKLLGGWFLNELAKISKVIVINGNHDGNPNNVEQVNSLATVLELINNSNISYYNKTGRYEDENIYWYVWDYFDGKNPYDGEFALQSMPHDHCPETIVDIYHNPVNGAKLFNNSDLKHNISIDEFHGRLFLLGDIHLRQFFTNKNNSLGAYPGSLIQQDFGEDYKAHGFLIWDITTKSATTFDIKNNYVYYNYTIDGTKKIVDYEKLDLEELEQIKNDYSFIRVKVKWTDYRSNINKDNERKIRTILRQFLGKQLLDLRFEKNTIDKFEGLRSLLKTVNKEDVINKDSLNDIFVRFLKTNKTDDYVIKKILALDEIVSKELVYEEKLVNWRLLSITIDNYRSHGDEFELPLEGKDGLWQIKGLNEHGKTNLLSAICYLLFGKTLETLKKEKNGDNRFINNKRDLDYCEAKGLFEINGELYEIIRRTERTWSRNKADFKVSTSLDYKKLDSELNEISLNDEQRLKTNKLINEELGTFEDFLRTSFITSDSLNGLLSADEAVFIDSILRDAGLDLFEKKLDVFKEWKKKNPIRKPKIDIDVAAAEIKTCEETISLEEQRLDELQENLSFAQSKIESLRKQFEKEQKKFQQIDNVLNESEIEAITLEISDLKDMIAERKEEIQSIEKYIENIPTELSQEYLDKKAKATKDLEGINLEVKEFDTSLITLEQEVNSWGNRNVVLESKLDNIKDIYKSYNKQEEQANKDENRRIESIEKQIEKLLEAKVCPVCKREKDENTIKEIAKECDLLKEEIKSNEDFTQRIKEIEKSRLEKDEEVKNITIELDLNSQKILAVKEQLTKVKIKRESLLTALLAIEAVIEEVEEVEINIEKKAKKLNEVEKLKLRNENAEIKIENLKKELEKVKEIRKKLELNKLVEETVKEIKIKLVSKETYIEELKKEITTIQNGVLPMSISRIETLKNEINDFILEEEKEKVQQLYQDCVHRDGIPKMLLTEMKETINIELSNLLSGLSFNVFFDDNLCLKMYDHIKPDAIINVIGGSGKQRTFISIALRLALRAVNNRCVNNLLFMDELMGKLVENSVTEFIQLLEEAKSKIEKIFIVEHAYSDQLNPDYIIEVWKDAQGVSKIKLN